jgi:hypothetical protein
MRMDEEPTSIFILRSESTGFCEPCVTLQDSAPRDFRVWGRRTREQEPFDLGTYRFDAQVRLGACSPSSDIHV